MENKTFYFERVKNLFIRQLVLSRNGILIASGAILGFMFILFTLIAYYSKTPYVYHEEAAIFYVVFMVCGYIFSSLSFHELTDFRSGYQYLMLPASTFEKLLVAWFNSSFLYTVFSFIAFFIVSSFANIFASVLSGSNFVLIDLNQHSFLKIAGIYLVTQPVFLLGSIFFKKNAFLKTLLTLFILWMVIGIASSVLGWGILNDFRFTGTNMEIDDFKNIKTITTIVQTAFWYLLAPFILIVSYFKLKETEI